MESVWTWKLRLPDLQSALLGGQKEAKKDNLELCNINRVSLVSKLSTLLFALEVSIERGRKVCRSLPKDDFSQIHRKSAKFLFTGHRNPLIHSLIKGFSPGSHDQARLGSDDPVEKPKPRAPTSNGCDRSYLVKDILPVCGIGAL